MASKQLLIKSLVFTGNITIGSPIITNIADTSEINETDIISGVGLPGLSAVISKTVNSITLDKNATAAGTGVALTCSIIDIETKHADLLDGQHGPYYLDYENFTGTPTIGDGTLSWAAPTAGLTNTSIAASLSGAYSANTTTNRTMSLAIGPSLSALATIMTGATTGFLKKTGVDTYTLDTNTYLTAHPAVSAASSVNNSGRTYIQDITLDSFGHITGLVSATETVVNTVTNLSVGTVTATNVPILSSDGADITTLPAATALLAGIVTNGSQSFGGAKTLESIIITNEFQVPQNTILNDVTINSTADQDTGINFSADNTLQFVTGAGERLLITNTGATLAGDLAVNGGDITSTATTFNILPANSTTINIGSSGSTVIIPGNMTVQGDNFIANTTTVTTEDDIIELRSGATLAMTNYAGIVAAKYDGTNDGALVFNNAGEARIGDMSIQLDGSLVDVSSQPIMTRDESASLANLDVLVWDSTNYKAIGKTLSELGLALANGGIYNEITVTNNDIAGVPLTVNGITGTTANLIDFKVNGVNKAYIDSFGSIISGASFKSESGIYNTTSSNNAFVATTTTGTTISRNVNDTNPALIVNQANASSTGNITEFQFGGNNVAWVNKSGSIYGNVFFDRKNTAYYLEPSSTTTSLNVAGAIVSTSTIQGTQLKSTVAQGTAPLTVVSTTKVTNLNVDYLDDQTGSYYLDYTNFSNKPTIGDGALTLAVSGTGLSGSASFTANQTGASTFTVTSNATTAATASTIVARDDSGDIKANTKFYYNTAAYTEYNSTDKSIDFVFID